VTVGFKLYTPVKINLQQTLYKVTVLSLSTIVTLYYLHNVYPFSVLFWPILETEQVNFI